MNARWWHAQANLAWHAIRHFTRKLWPFRSRFGLARFRSNYIREGLPPFVPAHRQLAAELGKCTLCGHCDDVCPLLSGTHAANFLGPMSFVVSGLRAGPQLSDIQATLDTMRGVDCTSCQACVQVCPEHISILQLAAFASAQLVVLREAERSSGT